ncbi:MAG TPA: GNAT family N-acetyltransferase [Nocardioidaceae bacterium]|nr:GNAT family N-acetyltransferase [Nocardioidaceae bacterium]
MAGTDIAVTLLDAAASRDTRLIEQLTDLVNDVYATAECGLWRDGFTRTTTSEVAELIADRQVAVATIADGLVVGSMQLHQICEDTSEFGMLVADPDHRGAGIGRALLDFAEQDSRDRGLRAIQLELLVPRTWRHPSKEFLKSWYGRRGFRHIQTRRMDDTHPHLAPLLATPCDLEVHEKPLRVREQGRHAD